jgi:hypothetical protein
MKKFFIAFLILAVTAGNVFAEITFDGSVFGQWDVIAGKSGKERNGNDVYSGWLTNRLGLSTDLVRSRFHITAVNEDKTWGAWIRIQESDPTKTQARVWWQPITQVKAVLGQYGFRPFGTFGGLGVRDYLNAGAVAGDVLPEYDTGDQGFALELAPIANLKIGLITPIYPETDTSDPKVPKQPAEYSYRRIGGWVGYTLEGIGTIGAGYKGSAAKYDNAQNYKDYELADAKSQINVGFDLTAIENLKLQIGVSYFLPQKIATPTKIGSYEIPPGTVKVKLWQEPISINLAADYTVAGTFGVRALVDVDVAGKVEFEGNVDPYEPGLLFKLALDPWANVGVGTAGLALDLTVTGPGKLAGQDDHGDKLDLVITPYFQKAYGGGTFAVGFRLGFSNYFDDQPGSDDESGTVSWAIPVGLSYSF